MPYFSEHTQRIVNQYENFPPHWSFAIISLRRQKENQSDFTLQSLSLKDKDLCILTLIIKETFSQQKMALRFSDELFWGVGR